jgi:16S rRNA (guanine527-N7)-methyltransferase
MIVDALERAEVRVTSAQAVMLARHAHLVELANRTMNLTRITAVEDVLERHVVDSLAFLRYAPTLGGRIADLGSGAGYPGIPLSIMGFDITLCESVKKKAAFLMSVVEELALPARVVAVRAEDLALEERNCYNVVVARALSALPSLVELAAPLLKKDGLLVALKGTPDPSEQAAGQYAASVCGMEVVGNDCYSLPGGEQRSVFVYQRVANPRVRLPRRPGMAQRNPLTPHRA